MPVQPKICAEPEGLDHSESWSVDVILLHVPHHTSQCGLCLVPPIQLLLTSDAPTCQPKLPLMTWVTRLVLLDHQPKLSLEHRSAFVKLLQKQFSLDGNVPLLRQEVQNYV